VPAEFFEVVHKTHFRPFFQSLVPPFYQFKCHRILVFFLNARLFRNGKGKGDGLYPAKGLRAVVNNLFPEEPPLVAFLPAG
jgi:hypothetical protein